MALIPRPPHTGNNELDSVLTYIVNQLNEGVAQPGIGGGDSQGTPGLNGEDGNSSIYLYARTPTDATPDRPDDVDFDFSDILAPVTVNDADSPWSPDIPLDTLGGYLWVTFRYVSGESGSVTDASSWDTPSLLGIPGQNATAVVVSAFDPTGEPEDSDPTMWDPTSRDFKNNGGIAKALVARVYVADVEWTSGQYAAATYRWLKNSQTTFSTSTVQRGDSGPEKRILLIDAADVTDSGSDVFVCEVTF